MNFILFPEMRYYYKSKISYWLKAAHRKGHGIHSPFLFRLITQVIEDRKDYAAYRICESSEKNIRMMLKIMDRSSFEIQNSCAGNNHQPDIFKVHHLPLRFDKLILRLVHEFKPESIRFSGSTFGGTLFALAGSDDTISVKAVVSDLHYRMFCEKLVEIMEVGNISVVKATSGIHSAFHLIQHPLEPARCDGEIEKIVMESTSDFVLIVSGIHVSEEMEAVWNKHKFSPVVRVALDLFDIGIFICRKGLQKEEFVLRF